jgi:hypothetical protein
LLAAHSTQNAASGHAVFSCLPVFLRVPRYKSQLIPIAWLQKRSAYCSCPSESSIGWRQDIRLRASARRRTLVGRKAREDDGDVAE